jgi:predicted CxxxxCH...CXXCH cytochrome family protein
MRVAAVVSCCALILGCARPNESDGQKGDASVTADGFPKTCSKCHGSDESPAPPLDLLGQSDSARRGVGAHRAHLFSAHGLSKPVACASCHVVPAAEASPGHMDGPWPANVVFGGLAVARGVKPVLVVEKGTGDARKDAVLQVTCASVYCHGAGMSGGAATSPVWNSTSGTDYVRCGACHGFPPALKRNQEPHPANSACGTCHSLTVSDTDNTAIAHPENHINGRVELTGSVASCNACHGDPGAKNPPPGDPDTAPPLDVNGKLATTSIGVGAHQSHLRSKLSAPVTCSSCHIVPTAVDSPGHNVGSVAAVTFGSLAQADGASPTWDRSSATCSTYCHGQTLHGGTNTSPRWTLVDGTQRACGTCHGIPPPAPHVQSSACSGCHDTVSADNITFAKPEQHVNGKVDVAGGGGCNRCHGSDANNAPPKDTRGNTATSALGVGAHQSHLGSAWAKPIDCEDCHPLPTSMAHATGVAEVEFGARSKTGGLSPTWNESAATCASTWCHGPTNGGGSNRSPVWTKVGSGQAACGTCHGIPPPAPHVQSIACSSCHDTVGSDNITIAKPAQHVDGTVNVTGGDTCNSCHGSQTNSAPPKDAHGNTATTALGVGAHQKHLGVTSAKAIGCAECHGVPTSMAHSNGVSEVTFGARSKTGGLSPTWSESTASCASTWCHGPSNGGGSNHSPVWTKVGSGQAACGTCHGIPPPAPHAQSSACSSCHDTVGSDNITIAKPAQHVDGTVNVSGGNGCNSCHGSQANNAPPKDTRGNTATTAVGVGAHQKHLQAATYSNAIACNQCHTVPSSMSHSSGKVELTWGALAKTKGLSPSFNTSAATCSNVWCHAPVGFGQFGAGTAGGINHTPTWTKVGSGQAACGTCHGIPPSTGEHGEHSKRGCDACHSGYSFISVNKANHINGKVDVGGSSLSAGSYSNGNCARACHGAERWSGGGGDD